MVEVFHKAQFQVFGDPHMPDIAFRTVCAFLAFHNTRNNNWHIADGSIKEFDTTCLNTELRGKHEDDKGDYNWDRWNRFDFHIADKFAEGRQEDERRDYWAFLKGFDDFVAVIYLGLVGTGQPIGRGRFRSVQEYPEVVAYRRREAI